MFKKILITIVFVVFSIANADKFNEPLSISIEKVDTKNKTLSFPAYDLVVGESGFVLTKLTDYVVISAKIEIKSIENGIATASFSDFDTMKQKYLPTPHILPKAGDMASFREINNKAFLIAPDLNTYEKIKSQLKDELSLMSSDLLMGYLNDYGGFDPNAKFLKKACSVYSVGLIYIVGTNSLNVLDCQSLALLESIPFDTSKVNKTIAPFFSRLQEIKTGSLASLFYSKKSKNYFEFYDNLIKNGFDIQKSKKAKKSPKTKESQK
ncbi:plasminogen-binding N-terminal domain-containing protein [Helicobacter cappadocius]|uniref:Plasminogen-binding N-terminal domain-containing protein n=1 Tax=Helicobacter cappadocius TaxID=3063998 RepID=A0AA90PIW6_9HELI|nr:MULTISPECIES: plasminogen-binding N-terminal domain-containing protein [unclassified Helicobacter]MDO7252923.1 plasminogen-binding N-terminal domain-containing protein [Helicobacter sp. faydin-H75]MDP2539087.1 plasminogen-binding N-terminal domain-containing protein [Helicobacter sp. faydin-H76]